MNAASARAKELWRPAGFVPIVTASATAIGRRQGEYPPGFDIEAVLRNGKVYLSFKETTGCVCGGSGACVMRGGSVNKTMPPAMAAGLLGASGSLCAGCMDTWRRQACSGMGLRRVPDFGVKASRP